MRTLSEGQLDILVELNADASEAGEWVEVPICRCGVPVEGCICRELDALRERRDNSVLVGDTIPRRGRKSLFGDQPPY